jgi:hypothetical protein
MMHRACQKMICRTSHTVYGKKHQRSMPGMLKWCQHAWGSSDVLNNSLAADIIKPSRITDSPNYATLWVSFIITIPLCLYDVSQNLLEYVVLVEFHPECIV